MQERRQAKSLPSDIGVNVCVMGEGASVRVTESAKVVVKKGRLRKCLPIWKEEVKAGAKLLSVIEHGYVLPLKSESSTFTCSNHPTAMGNAEFVLFAAHSLW